MITSERREGKTEATSEHGEPRLGALASRRQLQEAERASRVSFASSSQHVLIQTHSTVLSTHSIPSCSPAPVLAEQAWICQSRSRMLCRCSASEICRSGTHTNGDERAVSVLFYVLLRVTHAMQTPSVAVLCACTRGQRAAGGGAVFGSHAPPWAALR